ncbi:Uncharacterised protein [Serratia entomophila]|uniref:Uncharacterized protein n=1 Tax=Serratia entomophila TaxID=42906 RepID=A0ABY5CQL1_9GAMM|nr:hypothetical protein [Serratia entomophila]UIW17268.1 hypothetical protein KHA73_17805 [Serratia entomophila]USU99824.1 hypothetical protein KFQ06_17500 [Serratia entomophila]CAI0828951.1 Uncharacterised protein [Serratia entomophila]CAI0894053.1 Uncharacterised protein [Serratia entomophila]CAI0899416.1 Uncharacterised protein [Serratia entomophila]
MTKVSNLLIFIGLIIFAITFSLNIYSGSVANNLNNAPLFSTHWWARWFPLYASAVALLFIGLVLRLAGRAR